MNEENKNLYGLCSWDEAVMRNREIMEDNKIYFIGPLEWDMLHKKGQTFTVTRIFRGTTSFNADIKNVYCDYWNILTVPLNCLTPDYSGIIVTEEVLPDADIAFDSDRTSDASPSEESNGSVQLPDDDYDSLEYLDPVQSILNWLEQALEEGENCEYNKPSDHPDFQKIPKSARQPLFDAGQYNAYRNVYRYIKERF